MKKTVSGMMLTLVLMGILTSAFSIRSVKSTIADYSIISTKPFGLRDLDIGPKFLGNCSGSCRVFWQAGTCFAYFQALAYYKNMTYDFTLIDVFNSTDNDIWGRWNIRKNGILVVEEAIGHTYALNAPVGQYFKLYVGNQTQYYEGWHFSGWITYRGTIIRVPTDAAAIQDAINMASPGDAIYVTAGLYPEHVVVNKTVSIVGENKYTTMVDGSGPNRSAAFEILADDVLIENFRLKCSSVVGYGVLINGYFGNVVEENIIKCDTRYGIWAELSNNNTIRNNAISALEQGITLNASSYSYIENNYIYNSNFFGINIITEPTEANTIVRNTIMRNVIGIAFNPGTPVLSPDWVYHNNFINNTTPAVNILYPPLAMQWDNGYPSGGNYWSNYNGTDLENGPYQNLTGSDGIGDTHYIIGPANEDNYPLMGTLSSPGKGVSAVSNSTISNFQLTTTPTPEISFDVSGPSDTTGFCTLTILHSILAPPYTVRVDGKVVSYTTISYDNTSVICFTYQHSTHKIMITSSISATVDIQSQKLNLRSKGKWITGYIEFPDGYAVSDINVSTIMLNGTIPVDPATPTAIDDYNGNGVLDLMVMFNRTKTIDLIASEGIVYANVTLTVTGKLYNGTSFDGSDIVKVSSLVGDVNCDGQVNILDVVLAASRYGTRDEQPGWNANANFAPSWNIIDILDIVTIASHYEQKYP